MTLNETWTNCLAMWKWIAEQIKGGSIESVESLKNKWLEEHGFKNIEAGCFFCHYASAVDPQSNCENCPGVLAAKKFDCESPKYRFRSNPIKFYEKIVALNKERLSHD